jgi:UbiD family decarboxylase
MTSDATVAAMKDLREYVAELESRGQLRRVSGADPDLEIGGLSELVRRDRLGTALLFENLDGAMPGARVLTNAVDTPLQVTLALGYEPTTDVREAVRARKERAGTTETQAVEAVDSGPVLENVMRGEDIDLTEFPAPKWTEHDGGRYIGTGDAVVTRHANTGDLNVGTYRVQVQGPRTATVFIAPGKDGDFNRQSYFDRGEPFPVVVSLGHQPDVFMAANERLPTDVDELEYLSARRDGPLSVVNGEVTGLPFPSRAEVVLEGYVDPDAEPLTEGQFAEYTGYYGKGESEQQPYVIERIYHRDDPIVLGYNNVPIPASANSRTRSAGKLWDQLEAAGISGIDEVNTFLPDVQFQVVSIEQQYPGHSTQAATAAISLPAGSRMGRFTVVVDEDIDANDRDEVMWAMVTRCDPAEDLQVVEGCVSTQIDPIMTPEKKASGDLTNSRVILDATVPYHRSEEFPEDTLIDPAFEAALREEYAQQVFDQPE